MYPILLRKLTKHITQTNQNNAITNQDSNKENDEMISVLKNVYTVLLVLNTVYCPLLTCSLL